MDAVIARFNQFNYAGALLGAVMTGLVGAGSLRIGFAVPMVLVLGILPLARGFAPVDAAGTPDHPADRPGQGQHGDAGDDRARPIPGQSGDSWSRGHAGAYCCAGPGQFLSGCGTGRPGCSPPRASR